MKRKSRHGLPEARELAPDYPLQGTSLDLPLVEVLSFSDARRKTYIQKLLKALAKEISADRMALKNRISFAKEMRDLRKLLYAPVDQYLYTDDKTLKRNVLGRGSPGSTHTFWSRTQMWKMETKGGNLRKKIEEQPASFVRTLEKLFDSRHEAKEGFRNESSAIRVALKFLQYDHSSGTAFPPFHARFFADKFLPKDGDGIVVDPCAGWGGRLLGTLMIPRATQVSYFGIDPQKTNKSAYDGLIRRVNVWLKKEIEGKRTAQIYYKPFEDWVHSVSAKKLMGCVDLVFTSPPYFRAENYDPTNKKQSANRYTDYARWREHFYKPLFKGAFDLLKPGGHFVLNVANVSEAPKLEGDARKLATEMGFQFVGFYKLAMSLNATARKGKQKRAVTVGGKTNKYEAVFVFSR
jgi:hypothetical protein